jgi:hypothetical protein
MSIPPYPLCWPEGMPRTAADKRQKSSFRTTLAGAVNNVRESLRLFGSDSGRPVTAVVATTNTGGISLGDTPKDPGVAVWFEWDAGMRCIAVDRYLKPEENLQAIHHILEARRTEVRHGGLVIARTAFKGFLALPASGPTWWQVLGVAETATQVEIERAYREKAKSRHPDTGGSHAAMLELNEARDRGLKERAA